MKRTRRWRSGSQFKTSGAGSLIWSVGLRIRIMPNRKTQSTSPGEDLNPEIAQALEEVRKEAAAGRSQGATVEIIGVYPVQAEEPCHAIELWVRGVTRPFSFGDFKQKALGKPKTMWQCAWLEHILSADGSKILAREAEASSKRELFQGDLRVMFFIHYLHPGRSLITPFGEVDLPTPAPLPGRLSIVQYDQPD